MPPTAPAAPAAEAKKEVTKRDYDVFQTLELDLSNPADLVAQLEKIAGDGTKVVVLARVGVGAGINPRKGIEAVAQDVALAGDYDVVAQSAITTFKGVKVERVAALSIG